MALGAVGESWENVQDKAKRESRKEKEANPYKYLPTGFHNECYF